jgi:hypothetical protein
MIDDVSAGGLTKRRQRMLRQGAGSCVRTHNSWQFEGAPANADARWLLAKGYARTVRITGDRAMLLTTDAGRAALVASSTSSTTTSSTAT